MTGLMLSRKLLDLTADEAPTVHERHVE